MHPSLYLVVPLLLAVLYYGIPFWIAVRASAQLVQTAVPYQKLSTDTTISLLVLGDSTGVGIGADRPEDSVAGRVASLLGATYVENLSVSGAQVGGLAPQIKKATLPRYDTILIQIGANEIMRFRSVAPVAQNLGTLFATLPPHRRAFLMTAGDVGGATMFPKPVRPLHSCFTLIYRKAFAEVAKTHAVTYVDLYLPPEIEPFRKFPKVYLSADGLHPSSEGYRLWFEKLADSVKNH